MKKPIFLTLFLVALLIGTVSADRVNLGASSVLNDCYFLNTTPNTKCVKNTNATVYNQTGVGATEMVSYIIMWDLTSIPVNATITAANLSFFLKNNSLDAGEQLGINVYNVSIAFSWNDTNITYNTRPKHQTNYASDPEAFMIADNGDALEKYYSFNVFNAINDSQLSGFSNITFFFLANISTNSPGEDDFFIFGSSRNTNAPIFTIDFEPQPVPADQAVANDFITAFALIGSLFGLLLLVYISLGLLLPIMKGQQVNMKAFINGFLAILTAGVILVIGSAIVSVIVSTV